MLVGTEKALDSRREASRLRADTTQLFGQCAVESFTSLSGKRSGLGTAVDLDRFARRVGDQPAVETVGEMPLDLPQELRVHIAIEVIGKFQNE